MGSTRYLWRQAGGMALKQEGGLKVGASLEPQPPPQVHVTRQVPTSAPANGKSILKRSYAGDSGVVAPRPHLE